jgi:hypothetical protein
MFDFGKEIALCHTVASQFVGNDHARHILEALQKPSEETLRGLGVPSWLNQDVEHNAVLVHGAPKIMLHALDPNEHFIEIPFVSCPRPAAA